MVITTMRTYSETIMSSVVVVVVLWIYVASAVFQPYHDLEAGDNKSLKIQVTRPGIEPRSSCTARQELNHLATAAPVVALTIFRYKYNYLVHI